jgi:hypothetical protein
METVMKISKTKYIVGPSWDKRLIAISPIGKIAILMSGGIDSLVLYHLIQSHDPAVYTIDREDGFDDPSRVESLISKKVNRFKETTLNTDLRVREAIYEIQKDYDQLYIGINHTPPSYYFPELKDGAPYRPWRIQDNDKLIAPFLHLYKYHIIDLANQLNIDLSGTLSCLTDNTTECKECWQCREKIWGYEQLKGDSK